MSSDSEASHSSAQRDDDEEVAVNGELFQTPDVNPDPGLEERAPGNHDPEDRQGGELESMTSGDHGLTFARVRSRGTQQENGETVSELSFRPRVERAGSPESASTPDDSPSVQVRVMHGTGLGNR
jgi:hypothetical protein